MVDESGSYETKIRIERENHFRNLFSYYCIELGKKLPKKKNVNVRERGQMQLYKILFSRVGNKPADFGTLVGTVLEAAVTENIENARDLIESIISLPCPKLKRAGGWLLRDKYWEIEPHTEAERTRYVLSTYRPNREKDTEDWR